MNPIELADSINEWYRGYLQTMFYFRDPELRDSFRQSLDSGYLTKGPYLEATTVSRQGQTLNEIIDQFLKLKCDSGFLSALKGERCLYTHQESAIKQALNGRNIVVATSTGSGKTECFLYPILLNLYQEFLTGDLSPGVRALILYPMNALANDQRERLGEITSCLEAKRSPFKFSFGQYIGETPKNENDTVRQARDFIANRLPGELVLRSEMRQTPPHILLTNYSMLEYLLLRPHDSPLFDKGRARWWQFIVLDEAHQYRGSRGIEMAMLLRRLKRRLREGGRTEPFRCVATSATLAEGEGAKSAISRFATDLFGEPFDRDNIILGEPKDRIGEAGEKILSPQTYTNILGELQDESGQGHPTLKQVAQRLNISITKGADPASICGTILLRDKRCSRFLQLITQRPHLVDEIADVTFNDIENKQERLRNTIDLVELLSYSKNPESGTPLLLPRYHVFLRSLEGAFLSYLPEKRIFLDRRTKTQEGAAFEVALCRECGQHYLVGRIQTGKLVEAVRDPSHPDFGAIFFLPIEGTYPAENDDQGGRRNLQLCVRCGALSSNGGSTQCSDCGNDSLIFVERQKEAQEREDQVPRCISCGYKAPDPVREIVHGSDGPHAVIATTLYRSLPKTRKKLLAFADGRQEAAFFAWYLEDSYRNILSRGLLLRAARRLTPYTTEGLSLQELSSETHRLFREKKMLPPSLGELEVRRKAWLAAYKESLTDEQRISLEGVGLIRWSLKLPEWFEIPDALLNQPWNLTQQEAKELVLVLLDYMRNDKAVEIHTEKGVSLSWGDLELQSSQTRVRIGMPGGARWVRSWDGKRGKRAHFLAELLMKKDAFSEEYATELAVQALRIIWDKIRNCDKRAPSSEHRLLLPVKDARRLNPDWWRVHVTNDSDTVFRCDTCARLQPYSVREICARPNCPGTLECQRLKDLERNHYRGLYEEELPSELRVEEHTAQLANEKAREFQREFREGKIHVLSCSTTFELGVDLGDLDNIFLRNVPPETFNYTQRVGRAGRRGRPGFAITYCRRGPHDLYHFSNPELMLSGKTRPPTLALRNEKIVLRHMTAAVLSEYFRSEASRFEKLENLLTDMANPRGVYDFKSFLFENKEALGDILRSIVPDDMLRQLGLLDDSWIEYITGDNSRFHLAELEVSSDFSAAKELEKKSAEEGAYGVAQWARLRAKTIAEEDVLSFLSRKVVIPKYGFPVDVVELDIHRTKQNYESVAVALERDLAIAIAEFAPTSKVIANKKIWSSYGIKRVAGKEWPKCYYSRCIRHNFFTRWKEGQQPTTDMCCDSLIPQKYIVPIFGFVSEREKPKNPTSRPARVFATRPYFAGLSVPNPESISIPSQNKPLIILTPACPGEMVVLCEGKRGSGFYICMKCGAGFRNIERPHKDSFGTNCNGQLEQVSLGQEITTDVIRLEFVGNPDVRQDPLWFAHGLAYALVEGAAGILEVPSTDLNATIAFSQSAGKLPPIILYDNVPGGAGLVARLEQKNILLSCLDLAHKRVSGNCGCEETTSCYGCLRNYKNQFAHQHLQRGPVMHFLEELLSDFRSVR